MSAIMIMNLHQKFLSQLPDAWDRVPIERLGFIYAGGTPSRNEPAFWNGTIAWLTPAELTTLKSKWLKETKESITERGLARSAAKLLPEGSLLITTRATIGSIVIAAIPVCTNQGFKNIVPNDLTDSEYYYYLFQEIEPEFYRLASGSTFLEISRRDFASIIVPRPEPDEQRRIAEMLDAVDAAVQRTDTLINKLKWMKMGQLHDLLTRGLDGDGKLRDSVRHPEQFKDSPLGLIPRDWELTTLKAAVLGGGGNIQTGPFGSQLHAYEYALEGTPVVMPQDIQQGLISEEHIARVPAGKATAMSRHQFKLNDVVFARRGDLERCAAIAEREVGWLCGTGCLLVRPPKNELNGKWLAATYRHDRSQRQILARAVGSTMVNLSAGLLGTLLIAKPEFEEQTAIVERLDIQDQRIHAEETNRNKLIQIKKGLMHDLLTGRVRVPAAKSEVVAV